MWNFRIKAESFCRFHESKFWAFYANAKLMNWNSTWIAFFQKSRSLRECLVSSFEKHFESMILGILGNKEEYKLACISCETGPLKHEKIILCHRSQTCWRCNFSLHDNWVKIVGATLESNCIGFALHISIDIKQLLHVSAKHKCAVNPFNPDIFLS